MSFNDPTGHMEQNDTPGEGGRCDLDCLKKLKDKPEKKISRDKGTSCEEKDLCFNYELRNNCESRVCQEAATGIGLIATAADSAALGINLAFALVGDIAGLTLGPEAYLAIAALYKIASPIPNIIGTYGGVLWGLQGIVLGDTYASASGTLSPDLFRNSASFSMTISQDTAVSALLDGGGWFIPDPNIAALVSEIGVAYDLARDPLSPALSPKPPLIPTLIAPTYSASINFSALIPVSSGWSLFPSP